jgi:hypothetical protein
MIDYLSHLFRKTRELVNKLNPTCLAIIVLVIFIALRFISYNHTTACGDVAEYLNNPVRVVNGELPYRDFWLLFPPGVVFLPAFLYKIFGLNINVVLAFSAIVGGLVGFFSFLVGRIIFKENFFALLAAMLVFFNGTYAIAPCFLFLLISALFFIRYLNDDNIRELFLAGIFVGLAFLFRFYTTGSAFLAFFFIILIQSKLNQKSLSYTFKSLGVLFSGILIVVGVASLALIEIWQPMARAVVIESVSHGMSMNLPYFISLTSVLEAIFVTLMKAIESGSIFLTLKIIYYIVRSAPLLVMYILPFFIVGVSAYYLLRKNLTKYEKSLVIFFLLWGIFTFPKALGRSDISHLALSITPLFFLLIFLLQKSIKKFEENKTSLGKFTSYGFIVITILLLLPVPSFLANTGYALAKPPYEYEVSTKYGTLLLSNELEAKDVNGVIGFINENTEEGDYIFVTPWYAPPFYALTNRKNPTYYDSLIDLIAKPSDEKQKRVCNDLLNKDTKLIIHYADWGFDNKEELQFLNTCPILQRCIEDNFELVEKYGHYWIYVPKNEEPNP